MTRAPSTFRQTDLTRAVRGASAAGMKVTRVEIGKDGKIVILDETSPAVLADDNSLDAWRRANGKG